MSEAQIYTKEYSTNLEIALSQSETVLVDRFTSGMHTGEKASPITYVAPVEAREITSRFAPIGRVETEYERRWLSPRGFDLPLYVSEQDLLRTIQDPKSALIQAQREAFMRKRDELAGIAFWADAMIGKDGTSTVSWATEAAATPAGSQVIAQTVGSSGGSTAVGLNVAKLRAARKILKQNRVNLQMEEVFIGINAKADDDLLQEAQIISRDFNEPLVLKSGRIERFMGFTFVETEDIESDGTYLRIPVWTKKGMYWGRWAELSTNVQKDITIQDHPYQLYAKETQNSARLDAKRVVEIKIAAS